MANNGYDLELAPSRRGKRAAPTWSPSAAPSSPTPTWSSGCAADGRSTRSTGDRLYGGDARGYTDYPAYEASQAA